MPYVQFDSPEELRVISVFGSPQNPENWQNLGFIQEDDPRYIAFICPQTSLESVTLAARAERDGLLRGVYDPGILMAQRALRMAETPEETAYAEGKIVELDLYAVALTNITQQPGFPTTINWPEAPTP